jgi:hypothetical protein
MTAKALTAARTTKVRTNIKGLFIVTSLQRAVPQCQLNFRLSK